MILVPLRHHGVHLLNAWVDDCDSWVLRARWTCSYNRKRPYVLGHWDGKTRTLHSVIMGARPSSDAQIDHINHNVLDNRRCNLRFVTQTENQRNRKMSQNNKSGHPGVYRNDREGRRPWDCGIWHNGKEIHLGTFDDLGEAIACRQAAEVSYRGKITSLTRR